MGAQSNPEYCELGEIFERPNSRDRKHADRSDAEHRHLVHRVPEERRQGETAAMALVDAATCFEDQGVRGMKPGQIAGAASLFKKTDAKNHPPRQAAPGPFRDRRRSAASQVNTLGADRVHQWYARVVVEARGVRHCVNERAGLGEKGGAEAGQPVQFG